MDILELRKRQITLEPFRRASYKSYHAHLPVIGINIVVLFRWLENCGRFETQHFTNRLTNCLLIPELLP